MDTSRDYYEDKIADFNRYRRGRNLYQFCKDEGIDYNWMLKAQRQFGGKGSGTKDSRKEAHTDLDMIRLHFEEDTQSKEPEAVTTSAEDPINGMHAFIFFSKNLRTVKILHHDATGYEVYTKWFDEGKFLKPVFERIRTRHTITRTQLYLFLTGAVQTKIRID